VQSDNTRARNKSPSSSAPQTADADDEKPLPRVDLIPDCRFRRGHAMRRFVVLAALLLFCVGCSSTETAQKSDWQRTAEFMTDSPNTFLNRTDDAFAKEK
jgi:hypothetical protein